MRMLETTSPSRCKVTLGGGQLCAGGEGAAGVAVATCPLVPETVLTEAKDPGFKGRGVKPWSVEERMGGRIGTKVSGMG